MNDHRAAAFALFTDASRLACARSRAAPRRAAATPRPASDGFTLTELVITVAIIVILASIALPSYRSYMLKTHRTEAMDALLRIASAQEKFYLQNNRYAASMDAAGFEMPATTEHSYYTLATVGDANGFTASATVDEDHGMRDDKNCWVFRIDQQGKRTAETKANASSPDCWP